jgi:hypothetical protein
MNGRLADLLAVPARELLAHRLDYLPLARNDLQRLGNVLAHLYDPGGSTAFEGVDTFDTLRNAFRERSAQSGYLRCCLVHGRKLPCNALKGQQKQSSAGS